MASRPDSRPAIHSAATISANSSSSAAARKPPFSACSCRASIPSMRIRSPDRCLQFSFGADHVQGDATLPSGIKAGQQRGLQQACGQILARDTGQAARITGGVAKGIQHPFRHKGLPRQIRRFGLGRAGRNRQPLQHLHEQARQRQVRPFGIGGNVEQHHCSCSTLV